MLYRLLEKIYQQAYVDSVVAILTSQARCAHGWRAHSSSGGTYYCSFANWICYQIAYIYFHTHQLILREASFVVPDSETHN